MNKIYKRTSGGAIQQWEIIVDGDSYYTISGQVGGKLTQSKPTVCKAKNEGKANATTAHEQAVKEAEAKRRKKLEKEYTEDINAVDSSTEYFKPMLADNYEKRKDKIPFPVFVNPKLDGCRCIIRKDGAWSRNGKPWLTIPHILEELKPLFKKYPNMILDGELYNHDLHDDFNQITSLVKKTKPTKEDLELSKKLVEYHCYDVPQFNGTTQKDSFIHREKTFWGEPSTQNFQYIKRVEMKTARDDEDVRKFHEEFVGEGYEGAIIRVNGPYQNKRSKGLLKLKHFFDAEYTILDIREGKGNKIGMAAHADFETKDGKPFTANIKGPFSWLTELLKNKDQVIGQEATVRYPNLTPDGIPRFPYMVAIRDYE